MFPSNNLFNLLEDGEVLKETEEIENKGVKKKNVNFSLTPLRAYLAFIKINIVCF